MDITFDNGFKAHLSHNPNSKHPYMVQLYTVNDMFLTSAPCNKDSFKEKAEGLMYGYFAGWSQCKAEISKNLKDAINIEIPR